MTQLGKTMAPRPRWRQKRDARGLGGRRYRLACGKSHSTDDAALVVWCYSLMVIDPKTPGYDRWCEAAQRAHPHDWSMSTQEQREPWIAQARQKELDSETARVSEHQRRT